MLRRTTGRGRDGGSDALEVLKRRNFEVNEAGRASKLQRIQSLLSLGFTPTLFDIDNN